MRLKIYIYLKIIKDIFIIATNVAWYVICIFFIKNLLINTCNTSSNNYIKGPRRKEENKTDRGAMGSFETTDTGPG